MDSVLAWRPAINPTPARLHVLFALLALCGCAGAPLDRPGASAAGPGTPLGTNGVPYVLDAERSELNLLVYRAGALARLGHNHVIAARGLSGRAYLARAVVGSGVEITLPVEALDVDPPGARAHYGADFSTQPSAADIEGTRRNMLGPALLDAAAYPMIRLTGRLRGAPGDYTAALSITVKNTTIEKNVPVDISLAEERIIVEYSGELSHAELGLMPFSVMLGALQVDDSIGVRLRFEFRRAAVS